MIQFCAESISEKLLLLKEIIILDYQISRDLSVINMIEILVSVTYFCGIYPVNAMLSMTILAAIRITEILSIIIEILSIILIIFL